MRATHRLCDVVDNDGAVGVPVVHGREGFISFLPGCIPYFKFYRRSVIEGDCLSEEGGADGGLSVVVELVFHESEDKGALSSVSPCCFSSSLLLALTFPTADSPVWMSACYFYARTRS